MKGTFFKSLLPFAAIATVFCAPLAGADGITSDQARQILTELRAIRKALEQRPASVPLSDQPKATASDKINMNFRPSVLTIGKENAPLVLIEYADYQCPFCQQFHRTAYQQIKAIYIDTGKLRFVNRDVPLGIHDNARRGATAGRCAAEQGKYWQLRDAMIVNANQLQADRITGYAVDLSMNLNTFKDCVDADKYRADIDLDITEAEAAGITGTPSFILGRVRNGKLTGVRIIGAIPYTQFDAKIQEMLSDDRPK